MNYRIYWYASVPLSSLKHRYGRFCVEAPDAVTAIENARTQVALNEGIASSEVVVTAITKEKEQKK